MLMLCGATYIYLIHDEFSENWILFISVAVTISFALLLPLSSLHNKVSNILKINSHLFILDKHVICSKNSNHFQAHSVAEVLEKYNNSKTSGNTLIKANDWLFLFYHFYHISPIFNDNCGTTIN